MSILLQKRDELTSGATQKRLADDAATLSTSRPNSRSSGTPPHLRCSRVSPRLIARFSVVIHLCTDSHNSSLLSSSQNAEDKTARRRHEGKSLDKYGFDCGTRRLGGCGGHRQEWVW